MYTYFLAFVQDVHIFFDQQRNFSLPLSEPLIGVTNPASTRLGLGTQKGKKVPKKGKNEAKKSK